MKLALCIATHGRPQGLKGLLDRIAELEPPGGIATIEIVVVDNDPTGSARPVCERAQASSRWPLRYVIEPRRGIPFARNACLVHAAAADLVTFIDDDELPEKGWLKALVETLEKYGADVATGPIIYVFPETTPDWLKRCGVFETRSQPTGTSRGVAFTNNVVFRRGLLDQVQPWFDERMMASGGSDSHFFRRVARAGFKIVWANEAVVYERVPASRASLSWVLRRSFRVGNAMTFYRLDQLPRVTALTYTFLSFVRWLLVGVVEVVPGFVLGKIVAARGLRHLAYAAGILSGLGFRYQAYEGTSSAQ